VCRRTSATHSPIPSRSLILSWQLYAEPLEDFLSGARELQEVLTAMRVHRSPKLRTLHEIATGGGLPMMIQGMSAPTGIAALFRKSGGVKLNWVGGSLLASFAMMMLEDLSSGRALQCPCGQLFVSSAYQTRYCSPRRRWRFEQRKFRRNRRKPSAMNPGRFVARSAGSSPD